MKTNPLTENQCHGKYLRLSFDFCCGLPNKNVLKRRKKKKEKNYQNK